MLSLACEGPVPIPGRGELMNGSPLACGLEVAIIKDYQYEWIFWNNITE